MGLKYVQFPFVSGTLERISVNGDSDSQWALYKTGQALDSYSFIGPISIQILFLKCWIEYILVLLDIPHQLSPSLCPPSFLVTASNYF